MDSMGRYTDSSCGIGSGSPKAEGRGPKEGRSPKPEAGNPQSGDAVPPKTPTGAVMHSDSAAGSPLPGAAELSPSDFGIRPSFGFRPSAFGFQPARS